MEQTNELSQLNDRFGIPGFASVVEGYGGLPKVQIQSPVAHGEMYLHGAHVTSWRPSNSEEVLFVSSASQWNNSKPIRGGVPICFPWFSNKSDDPAAPLHGFARITAWQLESITQNNGIVTVSMSMESNETTQTLWPSHFRIIHRVTFGSELTLEIEVMNTGTASFRFEEAQHSYFKIGNIKSVLVHGLEGVEYIDKIDDKRQKTQAGAISFHSETDRIYLMTDAPIQVDDSALQRCITIEKHNSFSTVVWNPWINKAKAMADFGDEEWPDMICIETCNVGDAAIELPPARQHTMKSVVRLSKLTQRSLI